MDWVNWLVNTVLSGIEVVALDMTLNFSVFSLEEFIVFGTHSETEKCNGGNSFH